MTTPFSKSVKILAVILGITSAARSWSPSKIISRNRGSVTKLAFSSISPSTTNVDGKDSIEGNLSTSVVPPSWDALTTHLNDLQENDEENAATTATPLITLFRDTNGWCPFCERVWFALKIKNIPYQETLISLFNKPKWFTDMVPTGLVPVVLIHTDTMEQQRQEKEGRKDDETEPTSNVPPQRKLIWESSDILKALDEYFPDTPKLVLEDNEQFMKGKEVIEKLTTAGFRYSYNMRNETLTDEEKAQHRKDFEEQLDKLDDFIGTNSGSPFFLDDISALDVEAVPSLERWRYQLPLVKGMDITEGRSNLKKWFDAMDEYEPYIQRVAGDQYSWTAVASKFLQFFASGKDGMNEETKRAKSKADKEAEELRSQFEMHDPLEEDIFTKKMLNEGRIEAAAKIISNHEAIVNDATNKDPASQEDIGRALDEHSADWMIRFIASKLLNVDCNYGEPDEKIDQKDAAKAARTIASRLSVPRDVGAPAASILRYELTKTASALE